MTRGRSIKPFGSQRTGFTRAMWDRWLACLAGHDEADPQFQYLSAGIADFRKRLAKKEPKL